jgi:hypothetical protein
MRTFRARHVGVFQIPLLYNWCTVVTAGPDGAVVAETEAPEQVTDDSEAETTPAEDAASAAGTASSTDPVAARVVELYPKECWQVQPEVVEARADGLPDLKRAAERLQRAGLDPAEHLPAAVAASFGSKVSFFGVYFLCTSRICADERGNCLVRKKTC